MTYMVKAVLVSGDGLRKELMLEHGTHVHSQPVHVRQVGFRADTVPSPDTPPAFIRRDYVFDGYEPGGVAVYREAVQPFDSSPKKLMDDLLELLRLSRGASYRDAREQIMDAVRGVLGDRSIQTMDIMRRLGVMWVDLPGEAGRERHSILHERTVNAIEALKTKAREYNKSQRVAAVKDHMDTGAVRLPNGSKITDVRETPYGKVVEYEPPANKEQPVGCSAKGSCFCTGDCRLTPSQLEAKRKQERENANALIGRDYK